MKRYFTIFLLAVVHAHMGFCQDRYYTVFQVDSLPPEGIELNMGWKFHDGDNPDFAKTDFDDSAWKPINPSADINDFQEEVKSGICWLRIHLYINNDIKDDHQYSLIINQIIASELYLDGRLIYQFGNVSSDFEKIVALNPQLPVALPLRPGKGHVLAVRYAVQPGLRYMRTGTDISPLLNIRLISTNSAFKQVRKENRWIPINNTFRVGSFIILAILYLAFFIYNPKQKAYLFFFLYAICVIPGDILQFNLPSEVAAQITGTTMYYAFWQISGLFLLTALYALLSQTKGWIYWSLVILSVIGIIINNWVYSTIIMGSLVQLEQVRTGLRALKIHERGAWIITAGAICFLLFEGTFTVGAYLGLDYWYYPLGNHYILADLLYAVGALCFPVSTTIYIALDFAFTSQKLRQKLTEVEALSLKTLSQEKEKQEILSSQKETLERLVAERTTELKQSLENLKSTQSQLIQSEKMASLGELTAGIAHEIQNPLNFVNNFSEVSNELIAELKSEKTKGKRDEALEDEILNDISQNLEKINHHGKRAADIVKGMLQHSRTSSGQKELTDLNALADEYLRLSYHGFRAKDKSFTSDFKADLDPSLPKLSVIPQDIGRVILNLINNAFYAVSEKSKKDIPDYKPLVVVKTKKNDKMIEIRVKDNGGGIPDNIVNKIFQPFFTTKPTGQGTGLGLSLSYDIITKGHNGTLEVDTTEGVGTEFIVQLPIG